MDENTESGYFDPSSSSFEQMNTGAGIDDNDLGDHLGYPSYTFGSQTKQPDSDTFSVEANRLISLIRNDQKYSTTGETDPSLCVKRAETFHLRLDSFMNLKDSTKQLLCLVDEIQENTSSRSHKPQTANDSYQMTESIKTSLAQSADDQDDCSVYKRLTRKCHCLNNQDYNDFIIHFNECTKYFTSTLGEMIKNMRIVKKFLYMGGDYTKRALLFFNEGLANSTHQEKVEITQACAHADVCNVFDEKSIVIVFISWPCIYPNYGDATTQALAASFLNKLAQLEEGRRYLKFSSKITSDMKKVIRTRSSTLEQETLDSLNSTLNIMHPPLTHNTNVSYYCKPVDEGFGSKTVSALIQYRQYMTLEEVFTHLDLLHNLSTSDIGKHELSSSLQTLLVLFKHMLKDYDNSEMNIIMTNILNNVLSKVMIKMDLPKTVVMADTSTEPIQMKSVMNQFPFKKYVSVRNVNKSKIEIDKKPNKYRQPSKAKVVGWESPPVISKFDKFNKSKKNNSLIIVPIEERRYSHKSVYF